MNLSMNKTLQQPNKNFWDNAPVPILVAHRGGDAAGVEKENSLKAFKAAYDLGYRWFETDVVPSRDGVLLAIHGRGLQKHSNKDLPPRLKIQRLNYSEIRDKLKIGGENVLRLETLLDNFPDVKIFIDPKTYRAAPVLADFMIFRPQDLSRVCIGSFHGRNTRLIQNRIKKTTGRHVACAAIGRLRAVPLILAASSNIFQLFLKAYIKSTNITAFYLPCHLLVGIRGQKIVSKAHKLGLKVAAYTPNDKQSIEACLDTGVDAVMSDNVRLLSQYKKP